MVVYIDDILITGKTESEHLRNLEEVLTRLESSGFRLKCCKCEFLLPSVDYLGHTITADDLKPCESKVQAIRGAPVAHVAQLRSFLGVNELLWKVFTQLIIYSESIVSSSPKIFTLDLGKRARKRLQSGERFAS